MSIEAVIVAGDDKFRIVRQTEGTKVTYVLEVPKGFDALGCERWEDVSAEGKVVKAMRDFIIRAALKQEQNHAENQ